MRDAVVAVGQVRKHALYEPAEISLVEPSHVDAAIRRHVNSMRTPDGNDGIAVERQSREETALHRDRS